MTTSKDAFQADTHVADDQSFDAATNSHAADISGTSIGTSARILAASSSGASGASASGTNAGTSANTTGPDAGEEASARGSTTRPSGVSALTTGTRPRWKITKNQRVSMLFAIPFMVFMGFPVFVTVHLGVTSWQGALWLVCTLGLAISYVTSWLVTESSPLGNNNRAFHICMAVMMASQLGMFALGIVSTHGGNDIVGGAPYMLMYPMASWIFLSPSYSIVPGTAIIWVLALVQTVVDQLVGMPRSELFALPMIVLGAVINFASRRQIDIGAIKEMEQAREVELTRERERTQISADLHDVLGQTLTAISMKTDLAGRLLAADQTDAAKTQLSEVAELSRSALADVRRVVAQSRVLLPDDELVTAQKLLKTIGCTLNVVRDGTPPPGVPSTLVAHVIREATTNALRHARPTAVTVHLRANGVTVTNNGVRTAKKQKPIKDLAVLTGVNGQVGASLGGVNGQLTASSSGSNAPDAADLRGNAGIFASTPASNQTSPIRSWATGAAGTSYLENSGKREQDQHHSTGLNGLRSRVGELGVLTWGVDDLGEWVVNLTLRGGRQ